jgi:hypothetical protein
MVNQTQPIEANMPCCFGCKHIDVKKQPEMKSKRREETYKKMMEETPGPMRHHTMKEMCGMKTKKNKVY